VSIESRWGVLTSIRKPVFACKFIRNEVIVVCTILITVSSDSFDEGGGRVNIRVPVNSVRTAGAIEMCFD